MIGLRAHCDGRMSGLRQDRNSFFLHWREIANYFIPRRYKWLVTPNQATKGSPINSMILDNTPTTALRILASGMMSGITSPTRPWFRLKIEGYSQDATSPVVLWLDEVRRRMTKVLQESNFYNCIATVYIDLGSFGTAPMLIYEDYDDVIRCYNPCAGEYFIGVNDKGVVDSFAREFVMSVKAVVDWFGLEACSDSVKSDFARGAAAWSNEIKINHLIEPNIGGIGSIPRTFAFREVYWEAGSNTSTNLAEKGFFEFPGICPRWDITSNEAYGRSPAMDALGDVKQLQQETRRKAQAIDKLVNPPMIADVTLKNQPASTLPGGITYISGLNNSAHAGMRPMYQFQPPIQELREDIIAIQQRIGRTMYNDLFMMISQLDTVRTATEIDARREEVLIQLGPTLERFNTEGLDRALERVFGIMLRGGLLPPPPPEIASAEIQIEYVSMLAEAQNAVASTAIERLLALGGHLAAIEPDIMDNIDLDETMNQYANMLNVPPQVMRSRDDLTTLRQEKMQRQQMAEAGATAAAGAEAAKNLAAVPVGGGQNAVEAMLSGGGLPANAPI